MRKDVVLRLQVSGGDGVVWEGSMLVRGEHIEEGLLSPYRVIVKDLAERAERRLNSLLDELKDGV